MTNFAYPAIIKYDKKDRVYTVEFPDLAGCVTFGETLPIAKEKAIEALSGYLASIFDRGFKIPVPSNIKGKNIFPITPETTVMVPIILRSSREELHLNQIEAAKRLGISYQSYQKLENPNKANPTLKTLEKVAKAFGKHLVMKLVNVADHAA
ncbi:MAG: type II toxin-antitoxin system HicB family antitoxin [Nitrospirae bacterium]|nr:type II toxin-antitoxin system HicB family antitoxin [Nitrospirota bacterium]